MTRRHGYFGVATWQMKNVLNMGAIHRSASAFGASFICLIGHRFKQAPTDTTKAGRNIPIFVYPDMETFLARRPHDCVIVRCDVDGITPLPTFLHPPRSIYLFGGEDKTLPQDVGDRDVSIPTDTCLNIGSAATVVLYDRIAKAYKI